MPLTTDTEEIPVRIVGSSVYGRYPTISAERTYNMFITSSGDGEEEWLANLPGYRSILSLISGGAEGRGIFRSVRGGFLLAVVAADVYRINLLSEVPTLLGTLGSSTGEVFFDENLSSQICIVAGGSAKIYNYLLAPNAIGDAVYVNVPADTHFDPNYITYQNTYFIFGNSLTTVFGSQWVIFESGSDGVTLADAYKLNWVQTLAIQTKPDFAKAVLRIPGRGNNILVLGSTVAEIWSNVGGQYVYQRNSTVNIDYGVASVATIASSEEVVAWLGINEKSSASLMAMRGGSANRISSDGLDNLLSNVKYPASSTAFLYRQDGHIFYVLSFIDPADNFSILYDFTNNKLFDITDWDFSAFPARQIVFYNNQTYFISYKDGVIYHLDSDLTQYEVYGATGDNQVYDIPRVRITNTYRIPNRPEKYKVKLFTFTIESGTTQGAFPDPTCYGYIITEDTEEIIYSEDDLPILMEGGYCIITIPRVDLTISKNGGNTFSNAVSYQLKPTGNYQNQPRYNNLGYAQQITYQLRFWGTGRMLLKNGTMEVGS